jgi:hypothetical protein
LHESPPSDESALSTILWLDDVHDVVGSYWAEGSSAIRFRHLMAVRRALPTELSDAEESLRAAFAGFASSLDLAEAAKLKTDLVARERLVVAAVGEPLRASAMARENPHVASALRSVAELGPGEAVLHMLVVADVFARSGVELRHDPPPESWAMAAHGTLNRCLGALEHEVANVRVTLLRLAELIDVLDAAERGSD